MVCVNTHAMKYVCKGKCPVFSCWQSGYLPFCVTERLYPTIRRPLDEWSNTYILKRLLDLLLFMQSNEDSLSRIHHMEQAVPKDRVG